MSVGNYDSRGGSRRSRGYYLSVGRGWASITHTTKN